MQYFDEVIISSVSNSLGCTERSLTETLFVFPWMLLVLLRVPSMFCFNFKLKYCHWRLKDDANVKGWDLQVWNVAAAMEGCGMKGTAVMKENYKQYNSESL